jgi:hypothetical protein
MVQRGEAQEGGEGGGEREVKFEHSSLRSRKMSLLTSPHFLNECRRAVSISVTSNKEPKASTMSNLHAKPPRKLILMRKPHWRS